MCNLGGGYRTAPSDRGSSCGLDCFTSAARGDGRARWDGSQGSALLINEQRVRGAIFQCSGVRRCVSCCDTIVSYIYGERASLTYTLLSRSLR